MIQYNLEEIIVNRDTHKVRDYIEIIVEDEVVLHLPKKLNFTDEQIRIILQRINWKVKEGFREGRLNMQNDLRGLLGLSILEEI